MDVAETREGAVTVVKPMGPLVSGDANDFLRRVDEVRTRSLGRFVIDASSIAFLDSQGLEALLTVSESVSDSGQFLRMCGANETVREVLELTEIADRFEHYVDVNSAVRSFL